MANWTEIFSKRLLGQGKDLCARGMVRELSGEKDGFYAVVNDRGEQKIHIFDSGEGITGMTCTCREGEQGHLCCHMAAALFRADSEYGHPAQLEETYAFLMKLLQNETDEEPEPELDKEPEPEPEIEPEEVLTAEQEEGPEEGKGKGILSGAALKNLQMLRDEAHAERISQVEAEGGVTVPEEYRYFQPSSFRNGLKITEAAKRRAEEFLRTGGPVELETKVGFMTLPFDPDRRIQMTLGSGREQLMKVIASGQGGKWRTEQYYSRDSLEYSRCFCRDCMVRKKSSNAIGHELCVHELAALDKAEQFLRENNVGDVTTLDGQILLGRYRSTYETVSAAETPAELLKLEPRLEMDRYRHWTVQFKLGPSRMYAVRNIPEFLQDVEENREREYGKNAVFELGEDRIAESSVKWLAFIRKSVRTISQFMGERYSADRTLFFFQEPQGWTQLTDRIPLYGDILDNFFDTALGDKVEAVWEDAPGIGSRRDRHMLLMKEGAPAPALLLEPVFGGRNNEFDGVRLTGEIPEILDGSAWSYFVDTESMYRIGEEDMEELRPLIEAGQSAGRVDLRIGRGDLHDFYNNVLPRLRQSTDIKVVEEELIESHLPVKPHFVCLLDLEEDQVLCRPEVYYGTLVCNPMDVYAFRAKESIPEHYRDETAEGGLLGLLEKYLPYRDDALQLFATQGSEEELYEFLDHGIAELMEQSEVKASTRFLRLKAKVRLPIEVGVSLENDLLNLSLTAEDLSPEELAQAVEGYRRKIRYIRLKNGNFLRVDENEDVKQMAEMMEDLHLSPKEILKGKMHVPAFRALYVDKMLERMGDVYTERDSRFKNLVKEFRTVSEVGYEVPASLRNILRKYQVAGYSWLRTLDEYRFGGILADDMGLGKTLQVITAILAEHEERSAEEDAGACVSLIVCPASLVYNWEEELHRFAPSLRTAVLAGPQQERRLILAGEGRYDVLVTSYDILKRDIAEYEGRKFRFMVIDEAQYIKNPQTSAAKSVKLVQARTKYAMTGTPIENRLSELWSIFDFIMPGFLYEYGTFRSEFEIPVVKNRSAEALERLRRMVTPFILRRTKQEVLKDLPEKLEEVRYAGFLPGSEQQRLYDAQVLKMREDLSSQTESEFKSSKIEILAELTRIRQICCDPALLYEDYAGDSAKKEACMDIIHGVVEGGHKALLFSQFTSMLDLIKDELRRENIKFFEITGATPKEDRVQLVKTFNRDDTPLFLISLKAGGTGLNLTGADVVIHYDPWWNMAAQNQATDRAHRIGQTKVVNVYRLILKGTIEEKILQMQNDKKALADDILSAEAAGSASFNREELLELLQ